MQASHRRRGVHHAFTGDQTHCSIKIENNKRIDVDDGGSDSEEVGGGDGSVDRSASTAVRRRGRVHDEDQIDGHSDLESSSGCVIDTGSEFETSGGESSEENKDRTTEIPEHYAAGLAKTCCCASHRRRKASHRRQNTV